MTMLLRVLLLLSVLAFGAEAFAPSRAFFTPAAAVASTSTTTSTSSLFGCRTNAKKEKIKRNRENMRKFKTTGRRGTSRRKIIKKQLSTAARQDEAAFIAKCFTTIAPPVTSSESGGSDEQDNKK